MNIGQVVKKLSVFLSERMPASDDDFSHVVFDVLRMMMLLSAVDGNISRDEVVRFRELAHEIGHYSEEEADVLWVSFLQGAGYLSLRTKVDDPETCIAEFLRLADEGFVSKLAQASESVVKRTISCLESMADADGDFSPIEKACLKALFAKLNDLKERRAATGAIRL